MNLHSNEKIDRAIEVAIEIIFVCGTFILLLKVAEWVL